MADLSNDEIRRILKNYGCECGPITPQTKKVYLNKIMKLQKEQNNNFTANKARHSEPINYNNKIKQDSYDTDMNFIAEESRRKELSSRTVSPISYMTKNHTRRRTEPPPAMTSQTNDSNISTTGNKLYKSSLRTISSYMGSKDNDLLDISDADISDTEGGLFARLRKNYFKKPVSHDSFTVRKSSSSPSSYINRTPWSLAAINCSHLPNIILVLVILLVTIGFGTYLTFKTRYSLSELDIAMNKLIDGHIYTEARMRSLRPYLQRLYGVLCEHAGSRLCEGNKDRRMTFQSAKEHLNYGLKLERLEEISDIEWSRLIKLVISLPSSNLHLVGYDYGNTVLGESSLAEEITYLECLKPRCSLLCRFKLTLISLMNWLAYMFLLLVIIGVVSLVIYRVYLYRRRLKEADERITAELSDILSTLSEILKDQLRHSENNANVEPFLSLDKLRLMLQQTYPKLRDNQLWNKVKEYTFKHEPLILMRESLTHGTTLQWRGRPDWQGSAVHSGKEVSFEKGPTECLKIRNIVTAFKPDWEEYLRRELSARLHGLGEIKHIGFIKKGSKIIAYVMCASREVAGRAFAKINANYYNGNLLGVKFIRLDKYVQRFPDTIDFIK